MERRRDIWNELKEISPELRLPEKHPDYALPGHYFRDLPGKILQKIGNSVAVMEELSGISPFLAAIPRVNPFSVPYGYFNALESNLLDSIALAREPSPTGVTTNPFELPAGYFEGLAEKITARAAGSDAPNRREAPVVSLPGRKRVLWKPLAAAAVMAGVIVATAVYVHHRQAQSFDRQLAAVPDQAIEQYLQYHTDVFDNDLLYNSVKADSRAFEGIDNSLPSDDIRDYLDNNINITTPDTTLN